VDFISQSSFLQWRVSFARPALRGSTKLPSKSASSSAADFVLLGLYRFLSREHF
jgi:hypothetical protein